MPTTAEFRRALEIEREIADILDRIAETDDEALVSHLNLRLDYLTRALAELQAMTDTLASAA